MSGEDLRRVVGHIAIRTLLRRVLLSTLCQVYAFIDKVPHRNMVVWPGVRLELQNIRALIPFAQSNLRRQVSTSAFLYDACLSGYGVMQCNLSHSESVGITDWDERWRFKASSAGTSHRSRALGKDILSDVSTVRPDSPEFLSMEVESSFL